MTEEKAGASRRAFFVAGGTLTPDAGCYVTRPPDGELLELTLAGQYCSVLTPRQMGKSSLMVRTARRLQKQGVRTATVDVTDIDTDLSTEDWYLTFLDLLRRQLRLSIDLEAWWQEQVARGTVTRFIYFMRDVVLTQIEDPVVIFVDEIDSTLALGFKDDFFAAIRSMWNRRADDPEFSRLTFVLLGVASPQELIDDEARTPFNIGRNVTLREFSWADAAVLRQELEEVHRGQGEAIFGWIFDWTGGHPYLTQKLCLEVAESVDGPCSQAEVNSLVERLFLTEEARGEHNLKNVQVRILTSPMRDEMLALYYDVLKKKKVPDDGQSLVQNQLKLSGLVKVENGRLQIRNEIYRRAFDRKWVRQHMPVNRAPIVASVAVTVALLAVGLLLYNVVVGALFRNCERGFNQAQTSEERLTYLSRAFKLNPLFRDSNYDYEARGWFQGLSRDEQLALFKARVEDDRHLVVVVQGVYVTLADVDDTGSTTPLLEAMIEALHGAQGSQEARDLLTKIETWHLARQFVSENSYDEARTAYNSAIALPGENRDWENPATLYERARVLAVLGQYEDALLDLDRVMAIARRGPQATAVVPPTQTPFPSRVATEAPMPPATFIPEALPDQGPTPTVPPKPPTATPSPTPPPSPTPTPDPLSISPRFVTPSHIRSAVRYLIETSRGLKVVLVSAPTSEYPNLQEAGLVPASLFETEGASPSLLNPRVLSIIFNPTIQSEGGRGLIEVMGWNDPNELSQQFIADLRESSGGLVEYQIVEQIEVDDWPVKVDGFRYDGDSYLQSWRSRSGWHDPDWLDYEALIDEFDILSKVDSGEIDEVWLMGFPYLGAYESLMVGPGAFWSNSPPMPRNDVSRRFMIMGLGYEENVGGWLEHFGHRAESHLNHAWRGVEGEDNLWQQFILYDNKAPGQANCGWTHYAPNSVIDYDWDNPTKVLSNCDDWLNFPDFQGTVREMNGDDWGNGDQRTHHKWWFEHLPRADGYTQGIANNWWWLAIDPNAVQ